MVDLLAFLKGTIFTVGLVAVQSPCYRGHEEKQPALSQGVLENT